MNQSSVSEQSPNRFGHTTFTWHVDMVWELQEILNAICGDLDLLPVELIIEDPDQGQDYIGLYEHASHSRSASIKVVRKNDCSLSISTLLHEVAHHIQDTILSRFDETTHGPAFRKAVRRMAKWAQINLGAHIDHTMFSAYERLAN